MNFLDKARNKGSLAEEIKCKRRLFNREADKNLLDINTSVLNRNKDIDAIIVEYMYGKQ